MNKTIKKIITVMTAALILTSCAHLAPPSRDIHAGNSENVEQRYQEYKADKQFTRFVEGAVLGIPLGVGGLVLFALVAGL